MERSRAALILCGAGICALRILVPLCVALALWGPSGASAEDRTASRIHTLERLAQTGEIRRAEAVLTRLIRTAPTAQAASAYNRALARIMRTAPVHLRGGVSLRPSTNITRAANAAQFTTLIGDFDITDGGQPRSGLGLNVNIGATYRLPITEGRTVEMTGLLAREWFAERDLRHVSATARVDVVDRQQGLTRRVGAFVTHTHHDGHSGPSSSRPDATRYGLRGAWSWDDGDITRSLRGQLEYRDYVNQDARDATFASVDVSGSRPVSDRTRLTWGGGIERMRPALGYQRYWGANAHVGLTHQVTQTTRLGATARLALRRYDDDFASVDYARADEIFKLGLSASNSQIRVAGAVPTLTCSHTEHRSNIALYQTRYTDCGVTFSFDF